MEENICHYFPYITTLMMCWRIAWLCLINLIHDFNNMTCIILELHAYYCIETLFWQSDLTDNSSRLCISMKSCICVSCYWQFSEWSRCSWFWFLPCLGFGLIICAMTLPGFWTITVDCIFSLNCTWILTLCAQCCPFVKILHILANVAGYLCCASIKTAKKPRFIALNNISPSFKSFLLQWVL